jgi:hypothetical protein
MHFGIFREDIQKEAAEESCRISNFLSIGGPDPPTQTSNAAKRSTVHWVGVSRTPLEKVLPIPAACNSWKPFVRRR